jgi:hypothetical protein
MTSTRTLPPVFGPALRIATSPAYGPMSVHANLVEGGFTAFPIDTYRAWNLGLLALDAPDMETMIAGVRTF